MPDFDDLLAANRSFAEDFGLSGFDGVAHAGVAVVTCMDSRINPLDVLGMSAGDVKILRNAGARVTDDVLPFGSIAALISVWTSLANC